MDTHTPPEDDAPHVTVHPYDTAAFTCGCGERITDIPDDNRWEDGHTFTCPHCGRRYALAIECVREATQQYPECVQCGGLLHDYPGDEVDGLVCRACSYQIPTPDTEAEARNYILAHAVFDRLTLLRSDGPYYVHTDEDAFPHNLMHFDEQFREVIACEDVESLEPETEWLDKQIDQLREAGIIERDRDRERQRDQHRRNR